MRFNRAAIEVEAVCGSMPRPEVPLARFSCQAI